MKIKEMIDALQLNKKDMHHEILFSPFGESIDKENVLTQYPRPQLVRNQYEILNGMWEYSITKSNERPSDFEGQILVPFSPEATLSGVNRQIMPDDVLWYRRKYTLSDKPKDKRLILHFDAVDERCKLFINNTEVAKHSGGYIAFSVDITEAINDGENEIVLAVYDTTDTSYHARGKQKLKSGGMFYTAQAGIWQSVWSEWVPDTYVTNLKITPLFDTDEVMVEVNTNQENANEEFCVEVYDGEVLVNSSSSLDSKSLILKIKDKKCWSPVSPFLYDLKIRYGQDCFSSYFGMRKFSVENDDKGVPRLLLNNVPYFQNGILDQGYWPESLLTPPSEEAIIYDIETAKKLGFNMIRKHCKIEPLRWYYHCDRLGMLVWQDMINGGDEYNLLLTTYLPTVFRFLRDTKDHHYMFTARNNEKGRLEWKKECRETINHLYNCPCICTWVLFNEGWGQFDAKKNSKMVRELDSTRFIDAHSGWFDQKAGDIRSEHIYFFELFVKRTHQPYVISEYGGLSCAIQGHVFSENYYGYETHTSTESLKKTYDEMMDKIHKLIPHGLCAAVYTQLTDVEEEVNGLITYDRKIEKL